MHNHDPPPKGSTGVQNNGQQQQRPQQMGVNGGPKQFVAAGDETDPNRVGPRAAPNMNVNIPDIDLKKVAQLRRHWNKYTTMLPVSDLDPS